MTLASAFEVGRRLRPFLTNLVLLGATLTACGSPVQPDQPDVTVSTERHVFEIDPETGSAAVAFEIANHGSQTVYVPRCSDRVVAVVDRREGGDWRNWTSGVCPAVRDLSPLDLEPGETARSERPVTEVGRYRLRIPVRGRPDGRAEETLVSNDFQVE